MKRKPAKSKPAITISMNRKQFVIVSPIGKVKVEQVAEAHRVTGEAITRLRHDSQ